MMEICLSEILAGITPAIRSQRRKIFGVFCIGEFDISVSGKCLTMSPQSRRQHTVKHIKSLLYGMSYIIRSPYSHQISWLIKWQFGCSKRNHFTDQFFALSDTHSSDCDSIPCIWAQEVYGLLSEI